MKQFSIQTPGSIITSRWSCRILSVSPHLGVASLSASESPDKWFHRSLRVTSVELWPSYNAKHVPLPRDAIEARLTLLLRGEAVRLENQEVRQYGRVQRALGFMETRRHSKAQAWAIRFPDYHTFEKAVLLFAQFKRKPVDEKAKQKTKDGTQKDSKKDAAQAQSNPLQSNNASPHNKDGEKKDARVRTTDANLLTSASTAGESGSDSVIAGNVESVLKRIHAQWELSESQKLMTSPTL